MTRDSSMTPKRTSMRSALRSTRTDGSPCAAWRRGGPCAGLTRCWLPIAMCARGYPARAEHAAPCPLRSASPGVAFEDRAVCRRASCPGSLRVVSAHIILPARVVQRRDTATPTRLTDRHPCRAPSATIAHGGRFALALEYAGIAARLQDYSFNRATVAATEQTRNLIVLPEWAAIQDGNGSNTSCGPAWPGFLTQQAFGVASANRRS